jgi:outer membrane protein assembly factor BamB
MLSRPTAAQPLSASDLTLPGLSDGPASLGRRNHLFGSGLWLSVGAAGCADDGPRAVSAQERSNSTPTQAEQFAKLGYRLEWRGFPTMLPGETVKFLDIFGDVLAVQETAGVVSVIETKSGQTRWSDQVAGRLTKFVGLNREENRLLVSSESEVYFYDLATGNLKNKQELAQVVNTRPAKEGEMLVYGCANGQILGHLVLNGFRAWGSNLGSSIEADPISIGSGRIAICSNTGDFAIFDAQSGLSQGRAKMFAGPGAELTASDSAIYVASTDQSLYAFSTDGAAQLWRKRTEMPLKFKPVFHDGKLYCDMGSGRIGGMGITSFEAGSGKENWHNDKVSGEVIALRNKRLIVWDGHTAVTLDPGSGVIIDSVKLENISILKPDTFVDGHLYAVTPTGIIAKLSPK